MRLSSMLLAQPAPGRLAAHHRGTSSCRRAVLVRAQQAGGKGADPAAAPPGAAPAEQQVAPYPTASEAASQEPQRQEYDEFAAVESDASYPADLAAFEQQMAAVQQAAPPPAGPRSGGSPLDLLQHPYARLAGIAAGVFLGGTFLVTLFRMRTDPERKRKKRMSKNKMVVDAISKYLPGRRGALGPGSLSLLKLQTGFSGVEVFRKYLWFLLRERLFDEEAVADMAALKASLGLTDEQVAEALRERAQRVYERYGTVMVNMEGMSQAGIERKAASRNLFMKLLSLSESRELLGPEAAAAVDLGKIFGVTQRDVLTLRSGYSAEAEGAALEEDGEGGDE